MPQHLDNKAKYWLLDMLNECTRTKHITSIWRKTKVTAIPKPGKDPSSTKSYRPISLLCIPYKLYERLILMRISSIVDDKLTKDQAGSDLVSAHRRRLRKTDVNRCSICRPVSCIRHSSTPTNDKKAVEVSHGGWFMVVVIYPDSLQTNSAHKVEYAILLSFIYLQGQSTAASILPEQIDSQSYMWSLGGTTICIYAIV